MIKEEAKKKSFLFENLEYRMSYINFCVNKIRDTVDFGPCTVIVIALMLIYILCVLIVRAVETKRAR